MGSYNYIIGMNEIHVLLTGILDDCPHDISEKKKLHVSKYY